MLALFVLIIATGAGEKFTSFFASATPSPAPTPPVIEATVTPFPTPSATPMPAGLVRSDAEERPASTSTNLLEMLASLAGTVRTPGTLTHVVLAGTPPDALARTLGVIPVQGTSTIAVSEAFLYIWTQRTETVPRLYQARPIVVMRYEGQNPAEIRPVIERTLLNTGRPAVWLKNSFGNQATPDFQDNAYNGVAIRYINFPLPDLSIDYAIIPDQRLYIVATSQEAMYAIIDRIRENTK